MSAGGKLRVLVAVKRVVDYAVKPRVSADRRGIDLSNVKMSMNPFSIKLKDQGVAGEVIAVSIGPKQALETLRTALAMGADRGILIETTLRPDLDIPQLQTAAVLAHIAGKENADIVMTGKQAIDDDAGLVPGMIAAFMQRGQATCAAKVEVKGAEVEVVREVDGGSQTVRLQLPAVISSDLRLNVPRYATLPNIMKAKKKTVQTIAWEQALQDTGMDRRERQQVLEVSEPKARRAGVKVETVDELIAKLQTEAKVLQ